MSYCRFSSMNWRSDVYVYEHVAGGFTTHVAGRRRFIQPIPDLLGAAMTSAIHRWSGAFWDNESRAVVYPFPWRKRICLAWFWFTTKWHRYVHHASLQLIPLRPIGLEHDGETFSDETACECADRLEYLRSLGYTVPQYAIDNLREEGA